MTYKEMLKCEQPELIDKFGYCKGCPSLFGYEPVGSGVCGGDAYKVTEKNCKACWNREAKGEEQ